jgi:hypothetical protein
MKANKFYILCIVSLLFFSAANAQEFKTNESISAQLKKGTVPGTKISPDAPVKKLQDDTEPAQKISVPLKQQLLLGTYPGMIVAKTAAVSPAPVVHADKAILASNDKPVAPEARKPVVMPVMQEGVKAEAAPVNKKEEIKEVPVQGKQKQ